MRRTTNFFSFFNTHANKICAFGRASILILKNSDRVSPVSNYDYTYYKSKIGVPITIKCRIGDFWFWSRQIPGMNHRNIRKNLALKKNCTLLYNFYVLCRTVTEMSSIPRQKKILFKISNYWMGIKMVPILYWCSPDYGTLVTTRRTSS